MKRGVTGFLKALNTDAQIFYEMEPDFEIKLDASGNILTVNPSFEKATGYAGHEVKGVHIADLIHPNDAAKFYRSFSLVGELYSFRILKKYDGAVEVNMLAVRFERILNERNRECFMTLRAVR